MPADQGDSMGGYRLNLSEWAYSIQCLLLERNHVPGSNLIGSRGLDPCGGQKVQSSNLSSIISK